MSEDYVIKPDPLVKKKNKYWLHILLFIITFFACMGAGTFFVAGPAYIDLENWGMGLTYAILIITFLTVHEFGHYFTSRFYKINATLPYYIPMPILPGFIPFSFGTLGAVIRIKQHIPSRKALFDIGIAGPLAGFIVSIAFLAYGYATLPGIEYLINIHPEYLTPEGVRIPTGGIFFGDSILIHLMESVFASPDAFVPPLNEIYHYPFLCTGWFGLFVTALNLLPVGQLDGGHIVYGMFGKYQHKIAKIVWWVILLMGVSSLVNIFYVYLQEVALEGGGTFMTNIFLPPLKWIDTNIPILLEGWGGWLLWALLLRFFIKLKHPPVGHDDIGKGRMILGWVAILILILTFSYNGIYVKMDLL